MPRRRAAHAAFLLAGLLLGLLLAFPVGDLSRRCPPKGEGYNWCVVQHGVLPTVLLLLVPVVVAHALALLVLERLPAHRAHMREVGERRDKPADVVSEDPREPPPYTRDPFLLAATWGDKSGRTDRRHPFARLLARLRRG